MTEPGLAPKRPGGWFGIRLFGWSPWPPERILDHALSGNHLADIPGDFVLAAWRTVACDSEHAIVSSVLGVHPYFYVPDAPIPLHGPDVFSVVQAGRLGWKWNQRALRSLAWLGHTVGDDSLHCFVKRIPPCAVLRWQTGRWSVERQSFWSDVWKGPPTEPDEAVTTFIGEQPIVPLTGGFDSRALLAGVLRTGRRPVLITMGGPMATDRVVASAISRDLGIEHHFVELRAGDYLRWAGDIVRLTSGTKTAGNWHTFLYARRCGELGPGSTITASNGEFLRTYYLDWGLPAWIYGLAPAAAVLPYFAARLLRRQRRFFARFSFFDRASMTQPLELASQLTRSCLAPRSALDALDLFCATQRVRHFIGNGHALYDACTKVASPFLDSRMLRAAARLPRAERLGSRFHRRFIQRNAPRLADYPIHGENTMRSAPPPGYWTRRHAEVPYSVFDEVLRLPEARSFVGDSPLLDQFASRSERRRLLSRDEPASQELLFTLHFAAAAAQHADAISRATAV